MSAESRKKISIARKGKPGKRGYKFSAESRKKMSDARKRLFLERPALLAKLQSAPRKKKSADDLGALRRLRQKAKTYINRMLNMPRGYPNCRIEGVVGYTKADLLKRLMEARSSGVDLSNRKTFHVDHITPVEHFYSIGVHDLRVINALENLQALTPAENRAKGTKVP